MRWEDYLATLEAHATPDLAAEEACFTRVQRHHELATFWQSQMALTAGTRQISAFALAQKKAIVIRID